MYMQFFPPNNQNFGNQHFFNRPISVNDFTFIKELGNGFHGYVYQVQYKKLV